MALYATGFVDLPSAWPVPGVIDHTLSKLNDIEIPGGPPVNLQKFGSDEVPVTQPEVAQPGKPLKMLGDSVHVKLPGGKKVEAFIPSTTLTSVRDWR